MEMASKADKQLDFLSGGGEMGALIRGYNWSDNPLGPPQQWDQSLKTCVRIMLTSSQPIWIGWGPDMIKLYNDPYKAIVGGKHPWALGKPASVVWREIWDYMEPRLSELMEKNVGVYAESQLLIMERYGYREETYYTFSFSPIPGSDGDTAGMICYNTASTEQIITARSLKTLQELGAIRKQDNLKDLFREVIGVLAGNDRDFPFALLYTPDPEEPAHSGIEPAPWLDAIARQAFSDNSTTALIDAATIPHHLPKGPWDEAPRQLATVAIKGIQEEQPLAVLILGLNPYRKFDNTFSNFVELVAAQVSHESRIVLEAATERRRREALEELDKAKTIFFSNISHEFRTPLTLILSPLEALLRDTKPLPPEISHQIATTHRNALRLLRLVNNLLDFSQIESGKQKANVEPTDLVTFTRNLAGNFQSLFEKADVKLLVELDQLLPEVMVDRQMWERIVFNLISNAYKYTLQGNVRVCLNRSGDNLVFTVADSGVGIPASEIPKLFDRFYRVQQSDGRSFEGTGIGLSMVKELVALHHGEVAVESEVGKGSSFRVTIPLRKAHSSTLPVELSDINFPAIEEWNDLVSGHDNSNNDDRERADDRAIVLVVDDNPDMRQHLRSVLSPHFEILTAANGREALQQMKICPPDLVLSDIMMPVMDGIGLLHAIKEDPAISHVPVILLTARAGEESRIEGWETGADDYLVKPFSSRELFARIKSQIKTQRIRQRNEKEIRNLFEQTPVGIAMYRGENLVIELVNETMLLYWGRTREQALNTPLWELMIEAKEQGFDKIAAEVYRTGISYQSPETKVLVNRNGKEEAIYVSFAFEPRKDERGNIIGLIGIANDLTYQVMARRQLEKSQTVLEAMVLERTDALNSAKENLERVNKELIQQNDELASFTYVASHDLQEPLRKIQTFSGRIMDDQGALLNDKTRDYFSRIVAASQKMRNLINALFDYSRAGTPEKTFEATDLNIVLQDVKTNLQEEIDEKMAIIDADQLPVIQAIPHQFHQLLSNLLSNALKYARADIQPLITIRTAVVRAAELPVLSAQHSDHYLRLTITDNGIGFEPEYAMKIFELFQRLHGNDLYAGTGIGLAICKRIVQNHHGFITATGQPGEGATFSIYLPI
ncbi:ATP-binding protein [Flavihumibacter petaseus]|uniref:histidine kinase n=1 Tax=Flavihumibacter petaseus NBRC 106054 TaxID=1220578 RepID=A0A0E9N3G4_9BACT|nr:ATP-binding protein [Flavihumibacter petaseus]GAO44512.1 putative two-component hybrid sensor and regulator [Flavihumibacter petaseus NBRC 106054]